MTRYEGARVTRHWAVLAREALIGIAGGAFSGLTGVGGGAVMVPLLTGRLGLTQHRAHATSLAIITFVAVPGVVAYWVAGNVDWRLAMALGPPAVAGVIVGAKAMVKVPALQLRLLFGMFLLFVAFGQLVWQVSTGGSYDGAAGLLLEVAFGFAGGVLAGVLGVGGGAVFVPAIVIFGLAATPSGDDPQKVAQGVSLMVIVATGLVGTTTNWRQGTIDVQTAVLVIPAAASAALGAALIANRLDVEWLKRIFGLTALFLGAYTIYTSVRDLRSGRQANGMEMEPV